MYTADDNRYNTMEYKRCGRSGLLLPRVALGLWHNFGSVDSFENAKAMLLKAFDLGITHFDLANNYGPVGGSAEENFGRVISGELRPYRDELIISTKAGYGMWQGPYGNFGSRKYLMASLDQSLKRMKLDYVDIFYHHRPDPDTPVEETMNALSDIVRQGKALYVGLSNYNAEQTRAAAKILAENKTPLLIHQPRYNLLDRHVEADGLFSVLDEAGAGSICFSPLAQGVLTDKYLRGVPKDSRAARNQFLREDSLTPELLAKVERLNAIAAGRGQSLARLALQWALRRVTTVLVGASRPQQLEENVKVLNDKPFTADELQAIDDAIK